VVAEPRFTDWLRTAEAAAWRSAREQRFVAEASAGDLAKEVFDRYLAIEYGFVDTAAITLARTVQLAPTLSERRPLALGLAGLVTDQHDWFQRVASARGIELGPPPPPGALALHDHFLGTAAHGSYATLLAAQLGAEWLYADWCAGADTTGGSDLMAWIGLHTGPGFTEHVRWLRDELDRIGPELDDPSRSAARAAFRRTLQTEIPFHEAAYAP
jgi:thiaminase (transcriptional activator TenA)